MAQTLKQFKRLLRQRVFVAGSIRALARELRVNHSHLAETLRCEDREPFPSIVSAMV